MADVTYIESNGKAQIVNVKSGLSVMEGAVRKGVPGIIGECGGACACATCHVYVDAAWTAKLGAISEMERAMLESAKDVRSGSRLSCQIRVTDDLAGLTVRIPVSQY